MRSARKPDIFVDVCTQRDYLAPEGAHPAGNAPEVLGNLRRLMALARWAKTPTLSCVDARRPVDAFGPARCDCIIGTPGQRKIPFTILPDHFLIDSDNCLCVSLEVLNQHQQVILAKESRDPFSNPKLDRLLTESPGRRLVVFGVGLEASIRLLTLGLMLRNRPVLLVQDACAWWNAEDGDMTLRQLQAKGCHLISTAQLIDETLAQARPARMNGAFRRRSVA